MHGQQNIKTSHTIYTAKRCFYIAGLKKSYVEAPISNINIISCVWLHFTNTCDMYTLHGKNAEFLALNLAIHKYTEH